MQRHLGRVSLSSGGGDTAARAITRWFFPSSVFLMSCRDVCREVLLWKSLARTHAFFFCRFFHKRRRRRERVAPNNLRIVFLFFF